MRTLMRATLFRLCPILLLAALCTAPTRAQEEPATPEAEPTPAERIEVGDEAPDFDLPDLDGTTHHLADLRGEKPVVLVFFRGAW